MIINNNILKENKDLLYLINSLERLFAQDSYGIRYPEPLLVKNGIHVQIINKEKFTLFLTSDGDVEIYKIMEGFNDDLITFCNNERFDQKDLMHDIKNGSIHKDDMHSKYFITTSNKFIVSIFNNKNELVDKFQYDHKPSNPIELLEHLSIILDNKSKSVNDM